MQMHRQSLTAYGAPLCETVADVPQPQGSEVLVRIERCGVCHSDLHMQDGYFVLGGDKKLDVRAGRTLPFTLGHEIAGTVEGAGPDADTKSGARVAVFPWIGCGQCAACKVGDENICTAPRHLGVTVDGGFATYVLVLHPRYLIDYAPRRKLVESKSLKLYLGSFRNHGAFHEDCTVMIGARLAKELAPRWLRIGGYWYPRGGMPIDVFWQTGAPPKGLWLPDQGVPPYRGR